MISPRVLKSNGIIKVLSSEGQRSISFAFHFEWTPCHDNKTISKSLKRSLSMILIPQSYYQIILSEPEHPTPPNLLNSPPSGQVALLVDDAYTRWYCLICCGPMKVRASEKIVQVTPIVLNPSFIHDRYNPAFLLHDQKSAETVC
ncbi:hypothetical protein BYT27DRAFT_6382852 [Phlegmacium glaucopus]|nr:hypothetical protein BYT27DRAFT_6382852 [Phlegmacium glaucopus]